MTSVVLWVCLVLPMVLTLDGVGVDVGNRTVSPVCDFDESLELGIENWAFRIVRSVADRCFCIIATTVCTLVMQRGSFVRALFRVVGVGAERARWACI